MNHTDFLRDMAVVIDVPEELKLWEEIHTFLWSSDDEGMFNVRLTIVDGRVIGGVAPLRGLPTITIGQFNALVDSLRASKDFGIRPSLVDTNMRQSMLPDFKDVPPPVQPLFEWAWLPIEVLDISLTSGAPTTVSTATAKLAAIANIDGYAHLISISHRFARAPFRQGLSARLKDDVPVWDMCAKADVPYHHLIRSSNSIAKLVEHEHVGVLIVDDDSPSLRFNMFMSTALWLVAFLASIIAVPHQSGEVLQWVYGLLGSLLRTAEDFDVTIIDSTVRVRGGFVRAKVTRRLVDQLGLQSRWRAKPRAGQGVAMPSIDGVAEQVPWSTFCVLFFRWTNFTGLTIGVTKELVHVVARFLDQRWQIDLESAPRRDPANKDNAVALRASKTDDKTLLLFNNLLGKRQCPNLEEEVRLRDVCNCRNVRLQRWAGTKALVATVLTKQRSLFADAIKSCTDCGLGVRVALDDSSVASLEICSSHVFVAGKCATPALQIKHDKSAMLAQHAAFDQYRNVC